MTYPFAQTTKTLIKALLLIVTAVFSTSGTAAELKINITNILQLKGNLIIELVDKQGFDSDDVISIQSVQMTVEETEMSMSLADLPPGEYALQVFQDMNNNNDIDFSIFSGPEEPFGFSNNPEFDLIPPSWDEVKFILSQQPKQIDIRLQH